MGLSILIPAYNYDVTSLVIVLSLQLSKTGQEGEIIVLDDGSDQAFFNANQSLNNIPSVVFARNETNEGRMRARLKLSGLAGYDYLLFLDGDSRVMKEDFLSAYFDLIKENISLASGGRVYPDRPPAGCEYRLHWKYGRIRESSARKAGENSTTGFMANNFLVRREIFKTLNSSLPISGYGHEDTWWGIQFEKAGVVCRHLNNPVLHADIERADRYLEKSSQALANILLLEKNIDRQLISRHVRIFRWYMRLKTSGLAGLYLSVEKIFDGYFRRNLLSCKPRLFYFDCYRLAQLVRMAKTN